MAVFPCDWSAHRYPGPQRSVYFSVVQGDSVDTHKLRFCEKHFRQELETIIDLLAEVDEESSIGQVCDSCGNGKSHMIFAKTFDSHEEPRYFAADMCEACWRKGADALRIASGRPLRAL